MAIEAQELVKGVGKLTSLPEVCVRVNEMVDDPRVSASAIGNVISRDTALTVQLLRLANSAFYNFPSNISTISRAVTVIGERELRYLVLALSAVRAFSKVPIELINMASFWRHSVYTGVMSRLIAKRCHVLHAERLFVAGLMHDVGKLVALSRVPELESEAIQRAEETGEALHKIEKELIGCDHAEVGRCLLEQWNLPSVLCETVGCHHDVDMAVEARLDAAIVHIANIAANRAELTIDHDGAIPEVDPIAWEQTGLNEDVIEELTEEVVPLFAESWAMIQPVICQA